MAAKPAQVTGRARTRLRPIELLKELYIPTREAFNQDTRQARQAAGSSSVQLHREPLLNDVFTATGNATLVDHGACICWFHPRPTLFFNSRTQPGARHLR
jgi:hypothetical protein